MYSPANRDQPIVQKYGGTSVGSVERIRAVAERVAGYRQEGFRRIAVVVSAMSGETNRLVALMKEVNPSARPNTRSYDMAVSAGEQVSVGLMTGALEAVGVAAEPFLAYQIGIVTDRAHGQAKIQSIRTDTIEACWRSGAVPVVAGFQGVTDSLEITTLGRGGSDTSAVALAAALKAAFCEINTDVDGVFTADPRYVPGARLIETLDYETALELAALGSKVLHSRCVEVGAKHLVPIVVRNSFGTDENRKTVIMSFNDQTALEAPVVSGITLDQNIARITVHGTAADGRTLSRVFAVVAEKGINVDIIVQNKNEEELQGRFGFTVAGADLSAAVEAVTSLKNEMGFAGLSVSTQKELAKVSAVGLGMRSHSGVAMRVFDTLTTNGIDIHMISTSEIKISCVVTQVDGIRAARILHDTFFG